MKKNVYCHLIKSLKEIEKSYGSLENYVKLTTYKDKKHRMKIEEISSVMSEMATVYEELKDLEYADLMDAQKFFGR